MESVIQNLELAIWDYNLLLDQYCSVNTDPKWGTPWDYPEEFTGSYYYDECQDFEWRDKIQ